VGSFWHLAFLYGAMGLAAGLSMAVVQWVMVRFVRLPF